jgi:hypothetical protein
MTESPRFPYDQSDYTGGDPETGRRWSETLEKMGAANVRARLAQSDAGSGGSMSIGREVSMVIGFAQEWLAWHDKQVDERTQKAAAIEREFRRQQIYWTRWAALAASTAALAAAIGWFMTAWRKW